MQTNREKLKRIAAVHDISGLGKCSLTVALPVVSASGVECSCVPTALLSTHTGEFENWTLHDLSSEILPIAEHWKSVGAEFDGIYSGYLANPKQAEILQKLIATIKNEDTLIIVDPAMADHGEYYANLDERMCEAFRNLCSHADIITPNVTEAALLAGISCENAPHSEEYIDSLFLALEKLGAKTIAITGVHPNEHELGVMVYDTLSGKKYTALREAREGVFYGTGDIFASALSALLVRGASIEKALELASFLVGESIDRSVKPKELRKFGVEFERVLPDYIKKVEEYFNSGE